LAFVAMGTGRAVFVGLDELMSGMVGNFTAGVPRAI
jgi:hypothetical protein